MQLDDRVVAQLEKLVAAYKLHGIRSKSHLAEIVITKYLRVWAEEQGGDLDYGDGGDGNGDGPPKPGNKSPQQPQRVRLTGQAMGGTTDKSVQEMKRDASKSATKAVRNRSTSKR